MSATSAMTRRPMLKGKVLEHLPSTILPDFVDELLARVKSSLYLL